MSNSNAATGISLVIATPCFGGQISVQYAASLLKLQARLRSYSGVNLKVRFKEGDALITRARASLISQFLDDADATHLLFVDADIGFEPEQVLRLVQCGAEVVLRFIRSSGSIGPKSNQPSRRRVPIRRLRRCHTSSKATIRMAVTAQSGFVKVRYAGTGFLMIRRAALERMCASYPRLRYKRDHSLDAAVESEKRFALFESMIAEDGTYLSEDFAFCKRWSDIGGEIWADLNSRLNHVGQIAFCGDLSSQFAAA
jgi:hypothetical protein